MRLTTSNPLPFRPRTLLEHQLCEKVVAASGESVLSVWTPETYPYEDPEGRRVALDADYEVRTGRLVSGLFVAGSVYRGFVRGGQVEVEFDGAWT